MGKDFKIGLMVGSVVAVVALIWVATWDSLSPEARVRRSAQFSPGGPEIASPQEPAPAGAREAAIPSDVQPGQGLTAAPPRTDGAPATTPDTTVREQKITGIRRFFPTEAPLSEPNAPDLTVYEQDEKIKTTRFHIVRKNETLSAISQQYYGSANQWPKILQANKETITDANKIRPGTKLIIPD